MAIPAEEIERARAADIVWVAERLGARLKRSGRTELIGPCPLCGGTDRFSIRPSKGVWTCRHCPGENGRNAGGGVIDLVLNVLGCSFPEAIDFINGTQSAPPRATPSPAARENRNLPSIKRYVAELVQLRGSRGEQYLRELPQQGGRGIDTDSIADLLERTDAIGWHPAVFFHEEGHPLHKEHLGCIIGVFTDPVSGKPTGAISRTYLSPGGRKIGKAKTLGTGGGIIRLSRDEDVEDRLHLAEGIESALTVAALGFRPVWSCGCSSTLAKFPVLPGIEALTIFADHDQNGAGEYAAYETEDRWRAAGREVVIHVRDSIGDINDALTGADA
jgi:hypothetical protein